MFVERVGVRVSGRIFIRLVTLVGRILIFQSKALVSRVRVGRWAASAFFLKYRSGLRSWGLHYRGGSLCTVCSSRPVVESFPFLYMVSPMDSEVYQYVMRGRCVRRMIDDGLVMIDDEGSALRNGGRDGWHFLFFGWVYDG